MSTGFGRDEMNALIGRPQGGNGVQETAGLRQSSVGQQHRQASSSVRTANEEVDISKLTATETAAFLVKNRNIGSNRNTTSVINNSSRYRTKNKILSHHQLLAEELSKQQTAISTVVSTTNNIIGKVNRRDDDDNVSDSDDEFLRRRRPAQAAVVISRADRYKDDDKKNRSRRRSYDSSSSSSSEESRKSVKKQTKISYRRLRRKSDDGRGGSSSSSSSSSDEEDGRRRQHRLLAARKMQEEPETIVPKLNTERKQENKISQSKEIVHVFEQKQDPSQMERNVSKAIKCKTKSHDTSSSDDSNASSNSNSSSGSSSSSSSSSSEEEEEEEGHARLKPIFVPKQKRNLIQTEEMKWEEEEIQLKREKERNQKRKMESRALLARQLTATESSLIGEEDDVDEESRGAINAPPNDNDEIYRDKEHDSWELREIGRLLKYVDEHLKHKKEEEDYSRRKKLTDSECLREDIESGRYQAPGGNQENDDQKTTKSNQSQRHYHRGAYYMDESEWDEGDIRQKAGEYARTATGEDKIDTLKLPEIMQGQKFGSALKNTRYKGLANEDT